MTTELTPQQQELVAIRASVAAGCVECFDAHLGAARAMGLADDELPAACSDACECGRAGGIESDAGERRHAAAFSCCGYRGVTSVPAPGPGPTSDM